MELCQKAWNGIVPQTGRWTCICRKKTDRQLPVLVFIHGGGFRGGDKANVAAICSAISSKGFAVVSINYYLTLKYEKVDGVSCSACMAKGIPEGGFHPLLKKAVRNASNDTQKAFRWIKQNRGKYNFDLSSVSVSGGSAGAMTALYTAYVSGQNVLPIKAVINLWGGLENAGLIKPGAAPLLTYHGDQDKLINVDFARALHERMEKIGDNQSQLHILKGKEHAIYNFIAKEKIEEIVLFLRSNTGV
ncbi:MAG: alpha/beta hydrolase [Mangrovibacterium sp.]